MGDGDLAMWLFRNLEEAATEEAFNEKWTCFTNICEAAGAGNVMVIRVEEKEFHGWNGCRFGSPNLFRHPPSPCLCALLTYGARGVGNRRSVRNVQRDEEASWNFRRI